MSLITQAVDEIERAAAKAGLAKLARRAGVPYTTLASFANRGFSHRYLEVASKLADAAREILTD